MSLGEFLIVITYNQLYEILRYHIEGNFGNGKFGKWPCIRQIFTIQIFASLKLIITIAITYYSVLLLDMSILKILQACVCQMRISEQFSYPSGF